MWGKVDKPLKVFRTAARNYPRLRPRGPGLGQGHRGLHEVHHRRHVRQGRAGHEGRGRREVGRRRAEEDLRGLRRQGIGMKKPIAGGSGSTAGVEVALPHPGTRARRGWTRLLENERLLASLLLTPTVLLLGAFIAYPFVMGVWLSLSNTSVGNPGDFVGLKNFVKAWNDSIFRDRVLEHVLLHVLGDDLQARAGHVAGPAAQPALPRQAHRPGLHAAAVHHSHRALDLRLALDVRSRPSACSTGCSTSRLHRDQAAVPVRRRLDGMWCAIVVNTWRGMPFFAITLLAGLQTINPDLHEAASLDGANGWKRFWHVTWPLLKPVTVVVVVFSIIQTFSDFQLIYVLTGGGPGELHAPGGHLRLPDRRRHRPARRGRRHLAVHAPRPLHRGLGPAPLPPPPGRGLGRWSSSGAGRSGCTSTSR